jgi:drug/metabolite transporter (DMT)-like permease
MILYISPIYSTVLAVMLLGETIANYHLVGIALILPGLWLANLRA